MGLSTRPVDETDINAVMLPAYQTLDSWTRGTLTDDQFVALNEYNCFGFCLYAEVYRRGSAGTKSLLASMSGIFEDTADYLALVGDRYASRGTYAPKAEELDKYRQMLASVDALLPLTDVGAVVTALKGAKELIEAPLREVIQLNANQLTNAVAAMMARIK